MMKKKNKTRRTFTVHSRPLPTDDNMIEHIRTLTEEAMPLALHHIQEVQKRRVLLPGEAMGCVALLMTSLQLGYPITTSVQTVRQHRDKIQAMADAFLYIWEHEGYTPPAEFPFTREQIQADLPEHNDQAFVLQSHPANFHPQRQSDSTHVLVCPQCETRRYVDARFVASLTDVKEKVEGVKFIGPRHRQCGSVMEIHTL